MSTLFELAEWVRQNPQTVTPGSNNMADKFVFGNTMKSTAGKVLDPRISVSEVIPVKLDEESRLELMGVVTQIGLLDEAVEEVTKMTPEQLLDLQNRDLAKLAGNHSVRQVLQYLVITEEPEPPLQGTTSFGVSAEWLDWYMRTFKVRTWVAIREAKWRLKKLGLARKRSKPKSQRVSNSK